ncbi:MAG TPA: serine/threonine-protein kinase, partial [Polyangiales bacterium]
MGEAIPADLGLITEDVTVGAVPSALAPTAQLPERIGARYAVREELGRGGMAVVYRVYDESARRELALKQLSVLPTERGFAVQAAAFEREYHALVQLAHPRIIEVYDYGADDGGRYYTMELLDGGDLGEQTPLPWREACRLFYDVCSSLALLHSRKLVHRDVSPRNIHRSRDGSAKLIDFGAMVPMGSSSHALGTPPFVPPEVLHRSSLDGRADLFSFGATLYYALTGRLAYAARDFAGLRAAWMQRPAHPSALAQDIPPGLDALVLALVSLDPAQRPRTAFEVMQKLAALAELSHDDSLHVSQAYLSAPT